MLETSLGENNQIANLSFDRMDHAWLSQFSKMIKLASIKILGPSSANLELC